MKPRWLPLLLILPCAGAAAQSAARMLADESSLMALLENVNAKASPELATGILSALGESTLSRALENRQDV